MQVRYVMRRVFSDPKMAPPPLERLNPEEAVSFLWSGEGSLVKELLDCISPHSDGDTLNELKSKIDEHDPADSDDLQRALKRSLLWLETSNCLFLYITPHFHYYYDYSYEILVFLDFLKVEG